MSSSAILAQGTTLEIATGTGGAKTITAISQAYRAQVTSAGHGLSVGDRVTFAGVVGMTEINSQVGMILAVATDTFVVDIDSRAFTGYTSDGTATPVTYTAISQIRSYSGFDGQASEIDVTDLDSTAMEFRLGLQDFGGLNCEILVEHTDAGQAACAVAKASGDVTGFRITLSNSEVGTFNAMVKAMPEQGGVNQVVSGSLSLRITGAVTWA